MKRSLRTSMHLLVILSLLLASLFVAVTPSGASPEQQSLSAAPYAADSVLVKFKPGTPAAEKANAHAAVQGQVVTEYSLVPGLQQLRLPVDKIGVEKAVEILSHRPSVEYAEADYIVYSIGTYSAPPDDPKYLDGSLWGMGNINASTAWSKYTGDPNFVVAVIDTGIDYNHPDLKANMWSEGGLYGKDFYNKDDDPMDDNSHGTHVAGTIGAVGNNKTGVVGVNWNVKLMALKFLGPNGGYTSDAISALNYAVDKKVKVSNNSWGGGGFSQGLYDAIASAGAKGHLFVAAAGNNGWDIDGKNISRRFYPAGYDLPNIISVAAINSGDAKASWSNYGAKSVDLGAPGVGILSTTPNNTYSSYSGTSMASPHVAGAAALLWGLNPGWTYSDVKGRILSTARPISALAGNTVTGGTLDLERALAGLTPTPDTTPPAVPSGLTATAGDSQVVLDWADNTESDLAGYNVYRSTTSGSSYTKVNASLVSASAYTDTQLTNGTRYYYVVTAVDNSGNGSAYSGEASAVPQKPIDSTTPSAPTNLTASAGDGQVALIWTASTDNVGVAGYNVYRGTSSGSYGTSPVNGSTLVSGTAYTDIELTNGTPYYYVVRAVDTSANQSANSNEASATPTASPTPSIAAEVIYGTEGGRLGNAHLLTTVQITNGSSPVPSATVYATVTNTNTSQTMSYSGTTGTNGTVTFKWTNHNAGTYETEVSRVVINGTTYESVPTTDPTYTKN